MKFVFPFLGKTTSAYLDSGIKDYARRLERLVPVDIIVLREKVSKSLPDETFKQKEANQLLGHCPDSSFLVALDGGGRMMDSESFAQALTDWQDRGVKNVYFVIGGHLGLHEEVLARADLVLSLSPMTFTHELTRLILLEQVYRACMIKSGRKYHN